MSDNLKFKSSMDLIPELAEHLGMPIPADLEDIDTYMPLLERMRSEGCHVLLKIDGPRPGKSQYTAVVSGTPLGDETLHIDARSLAMAMAYVVILYAHACWGFQNG